MSVKTIAMFPNYSKARIAKHHCVKTNPVVLYKKHGTFFVFWKTSYLYYTAAMAN